MAQKFYVASRGNSYLTLSEKPGEVTEDLIKDNIERMMWMDVEDEEATSWERVYGAASWFYEENIERILEMIELHAELIEIPEDEAEEIQSLSFEEWKMWEFESAEWD